MTGRSVLIVVAAALVRSDGSLLLARRPEGKSMAGLWEFPGGKLEPGESPEAGLVRELREELAIEVDEADLSAFAFASHSYDRFHLLMPLYMCRSWRGDPEAREGQALAWAAPADLRSFAVPPADMPLIERFIAWSELGW
ncbi:8-oxo-dGTP diphosphatase MutT [bacterium]|nr:8-oxo-dGTP diphosphatase MutT [bacterium]